ncbi:rhomboid family intramembrane serine protease [Acanthopleuribacter pedis]|uniref:Rhomboid family intramembrane serine protease n=1 Tax=Acanthopleuribacter pedis TaxID=442870 RepID=A0A8J7QLJ5_9BACT|nr:rhomboid family intramembrane serine protease [Acanthopleuribacter pedis]MBO1322025.1 rhomboid family intramembrane serine protease [Acanthopleuribacter pedis]
MQQPERAAQAESRFALQLLAVCGFLLIIWTIKWCELWFDTRFAHWGVVPRTLTGLRGVLTMPLLHGDFQHLMANSSAFLILGLLLLHFHGRRGVQHFAALWLLSGSMVWLLARQVTHIGLSGVIYGISAFLFFDGMRRRNRAGSGVALITALLFGGSVWGMLPGQPGISWEGHLFGAISGLLLALRQPKPEPPPAEKRAPPEDDNWLWNE